MPLSTLDRHFPELWFSKPCGRLGRYGAALCKCHLCGQGRKGWLHLFSFLASGQMPSSLIAWTFLFCMLLQCKPSSIDDGFLLLSRQSWAVPLGWLAALYSPLFTGSMYASWTTCYLPLCRIQRSTLSICAGAPWLWYPAWQALLSQWAESATGHAR